MVWARTHAASTTAEAIEMRHGRRAWIVLALVTAAFAASSSAVAAASSSTTTTSSAPTTSSGAASKTTSPTAWANGVCSSVQTWLDSVKSTVTGLKGAGSLDAAMNQAKTGVQAATDTLKSSVDALGTPSTSDGAKARTAVNGLVTHLQGVSTSIQQTLADPGSSAVEIAGSLAQVGSDIGEAADQVKSTGTALKGLKPNGQLKKAFQQSASCQKLKASV